ncbi:MAG: ABC transporter permease [Acidobacteria bacterium]|nr:MAG: ABC transporter permease [Acidobacteriota bacterium]
MSTPANAISGSPAMAPANIAPLRRFYWSVRRELWENRYLYVAPLAVAALIVMGFALGLVHLPDTLRAASTLDAMRQHEDIEQPYNFAALLLMFTTFLIGVFYCLDALYGERRDRSVLFWKSLPVSDLTIVLSKASIPFVVIPLGTWVITAVTQAIMLLLAGGRLMGTGLSVSLHVSFWRMASMLFYHLVVVHGLWYAPIWGWLLLCSAWSRRTPYLWATLPLLAVGLVEKIAFNTSHFAGWLAYRFMGGPEGMPPRNTSMTMDALTAPPAQFLASPGFWFGLALAAAFVAAAVRLRRYQAPI